MDRTDNDGTWTSDDDGLTWHLVEPSQAWLDARAAQVVPDPEPDPLEQALAVLGELTPDELRKVVALGVLFTQPAAVTALQGAVTAADPMAGVEVVTDVVVNAADA
jgi:hypothetical protein